MPTSPSRQPVGGTSSPRARGSRNLPAASSSKLSPKAKTILYLEQNHAKFHAPSKGESVFFDECNREIISATSGFEQTNKTRVIFQRTDMEAPLKFILPVEKRILSIKLNLARNVLAYHIERNIIEFINILEQHDGDGSVRHVIDSKRYVQSSRAKNSKLIGFLWTGVNDLVIITDLSVEFYHVDASRHRISHVKMFQSSTNWFVYQPHMATSAAGDPSHDLNDRYSILMVSTGSLGNSMQPYMFSRGRMVRLQRFEVEGSWQDSEKLELFERSITIANIYGYVRLLVLQHESLNVKSKGAQIVMFTVDPVSGVTSKTHTLDLDVSGRFAINVLDNLVVAHDQPTKTSFVFDIMIKSTEKSDCPDHFVSLLDSRPIKQLQLANGKLVDMYSLNWVFFQPHFIVDAKLGLLTMLKLDLSSITDILQDNNLILSFLSYRKDSSKVVLKKCKKIVADAYSLATSNQSPLAIPLAEVSSTFEHLGQLIKSAPEPSQESIQPQDYKSSHIGESVQALSELELWPQLIEPSIDQSDAQAEIFQQLDNENLVKPAHYHFISSTLLEFIYVLARYGKNVDPCIYDQLLDCMLVAGRHFQIVQLVRGGILKNSVRLANFMCSITDEWRLYSEASACLERESILGDAQQDRAGDAERAHTASGQFDASSDSNARSNSGRPET